MKRNIIIVLGGIFAVLLIAPPVTYIIWQMQARVAVSAFATDVEFIGGDLVVMEDGDTESIESDGTLRIDGAKIEMPIFSSTDERVLYDGAWHVKGSAPLGEVGNAVIFGHRFLNLPPSKNTMFNLHKVNVGDIIDIERDGMKYRYKVTESKVVPPQQVSILEDTETATLTLVTCTPIFTTTNRLVVIAELI